MTIALEQLADGSIADRNFQTLARLVLDTGGITAGVRFGTVTFTWTAAAASATMTVAHGLGRTPIAVFVADWWIPGTAAGFSPVKSIGAATFDTRGEVGPAYGAISASVTTGWVAIG
jgi:hypothetical protein